MSHTAFCCIIPQRTPQKSPSPANDPFWACFKAVARAMQGKKGLCEALSAIVEAKREAANV